MNAPLRNPVAVLKERPFDGRLRVLQVDWSRAPSIAEILDAQADVPDNFRERCVARVVDEIVPRVMWRYVRPKPCCIRNCKVIDVVVIFSLPLGNGGGRSGSSGGAAKKIRSRRWRPSRCCSPPPRVSGGALAALGPGFAAFGASTIGANIAGAAIGIGGSLESLRLAAGAAMTAVDIIRQTNAVHLFTDAAACSTSEGALVSRIQKAWPLLCLDAAVAGRGSVADVCCHLRPPRISEGDELRQPEKNCAPDSRQLRSRKRPARTRALASGSI